MDTDGTIAPAADRMGLGNGQPGRRGALGEGVRGLIIEYLWYETGSFMR
jgi:hypothetical protein